MKHLRTELYFVPPLLRNSDAQGYRKTTRGGAGGRDMETEGQTERQKEREGEGHAVSVAIMSCIPTACRRWAQTGRGTLPGGERGGRRQLQFNWDPPAAPVVRPTIRPSRPAADLPPNE